ncbi:hypothetical protein [Exiguobacterium sp. s127]|uniref:hypothetical protein n=1 Tax=Exiguobacterium sp. s127 TaxID=2751210 RepID=UPI001BE8C558|nr:hypothetical protein [Exiguobacterium sp. s127]
MTIVQIGPTCGIYAWLNGLKAMFELEELTSVEMESLVLELLKNNERTLYNKEEKGKTFVGEFFALEDYIAFLSGNRAFVIDEIHKITGKKISFDIFTMKINDSEECLKEQKCLFICSILPRNSLLPSRKVDKNKTILHWISFLSKSDDRKYRVMDSRYRRELNMSWKKIYAQHKRLDEEKYCWENFNRETKKDGIFAYLMTRVFLKPKKMDEINEYLMTRVNQKDCYISQGILENVDYEVGEIVCLREVSKCSVERSNEKLSTEV